MHVFHFKGVSAILVFLLAVVAALAILVALPSAFMMVLWNATVFEAANGPEIDFMQGLLLWSFMAAMIKAIFNPTIKLPFQLVQQNPKAEKPVALKSEKAETPAEPVAKEVEPQLDNQQNQG